jgi:hypothetical protein
LRAWAIRGVAGWYRLGGRIGEVQHLHMIATPCPRHRLTLTLALTLALALTLTLMPHLVLISRVLVDRDKGEQTLARAWLEVGDGVSVRVRVRVRARARARVRVRVRVRVRARARAMVRVRALRAPLASRAMLNIPLEKPRAWISSCSTRPRYAAT